ncbi:MAG: SRPBCC family protein [Devosia sp.]
MTTRVQREIWTDVPREALVTRLLDTLGWTSWAGVSEAKIVQAGPSGPSSPGEIRQFLRGGVLGTEEVMAPVGDEVLRYRLISGLPLRDYVGEVRITEAKGRRHVVWQSQFTPPVPMTGWVFALGLRGFFDRLLAGLVGR